MGAFGFAFRNWSWLAPTMLCVAFGFYAGVEHLEVLELKAAAATEQAAAEKVINDAKAADAIKTAKLEAEHAAQVTMLQEKANEQQVTIAAAPRSDTCIHTPAARAFLDGLPSPYKAAADPPRPTSGADSGLPR